MTCWSTTRAWAGPGPIEHSAAEKADELIAVNLTAPIHLTRLLIPGMAERRHGRIVFVSSIAAATGVRGEAVYAAAKAGLACFAESIAYELADRGVGVSLIVPGVVDTPFFERRGRPYDRRRPVPIHSERIAQAVITATQRDRSVVFRPAVDAVPCGAARYRAGRVPGPGHPVRLTGWPGESNSVEHLAGSQLKAAQRNQ